MSDRLEKSVWLLDILKSLCLEQFFNKIVLDLQVTQIEHFEFVRVDDLLRVGLARPAARRLLDCLRRRRQQIWRRNLISRLVPAARIHGGARSLTGSGGGGGDDEAAQSDRGDVSNVVGELQASMIRLTCLIREEDILLHEVLGQGSFGVVRRGEWVDHAGRSLNVAVKVLKQQQQQVPNKQQSAACGTGVFDEFIKEVQAMHQLSHQHIITLYGIVLASPMMMVTELASLGNLRDFIRKQCSQISVAVLHRYSEQVADGLSYMQKHRLVHGDVACRNLLLVSKHTVKICDFGLMCTVPEHEQYYTLKPDMKVPLPWCAPETLKARQLSHSSDVWMFGVCVWEMFSLGDTPWPNLNGSEILHVIDVKGDRLSQPLLCSDQIYKILLQCWRQRPSERPDFSALLGLLHEATPRLMRAVQAYTGPQRLGLDVGEEVVIIDGRAENHWWTGQSLSSWLVGSFPRNLVQPTDCPLNCSDISRPLNNSFIHTGHGSRTGESNWGSPAFIDRMYLANPVEPIDRHSSANRAKSPLLPPCARMEVPVNSVLEKYSVDQWHVQKFNGCDSEASKTPANHAVPPSLLTPDTSPPLIGSSVLPPTTYSAGGAAGGSTYSVDTFTSDSNSTSDVVRGDTGVFGCLNSGGSQSGSGARDSSYYNVMDASSRYYQPPFEVGSEEPCDHEPDPFDTSVVVDSSAGLARSQCDRTDQLPVPVLPVSGCPLISGVTAARGNSVFSPGSSSCALRNSVVAPGSNSLTPGNSTFSPENSSFSPGNSTFSLGNSSCAPGNIVVSPGISTCPPGNSAFTPGNITINTSNTPASSLSVSDSRVSLTRSPNSILQPLQQPQVASPPAGIKSVASHQWYRPPFIASEMRQLSPASLLPSDPPDTASDIEHLCARLGVSRGVSLPLFGPCSGSIPTLIPQPVSGVSIENVSAKPQPSAPSVSISSVLADFDPLTANERANKTRAHYLRAPPSSVKIAEVRPFRRTVSSALSNTSQPSRSESVVGKASGQIHQLNSSLPPLKLGVQRCAESKFPNAVGKR